MKDRGGAYPEATSLLLGLGGCLLLSLLIVALRGVRWEESYEHALMITRLAPYPEGHPDYIYSRNIFSLQSYLSAALLYFRHDPLLLCGLRNLLQSLFIMAPVFLFTFLFTKRLRWSFAAIALLLTGSHVFFQSYYPIVIWPAFYSVGQVGLAYALITLWAIAARHRRLAWFLVALMPAIHIGQWPIVLALALLDALWQPPFKAAPLHRQPLLYALIGAALVLLFGLLLTQFHAPLPATGPYAAPGDSLPIFEAYSKLHDVHRHIARWNPFAHSIMIMAAALFFFGLAAKREAKEQTARRPYLTLFFYALGITAAVLIAKTTHACLREKTPFLILGWMPYRLPNHLPPLMLAAMLGVLLSDPARPGRINRHGPLLLLAALGFALAMLSAPAWAPAAVAERYCSGREALFFFLFGLSSLTLLRQLKLTRPMTGLLVLPGLLALGAYNQFVAAMVLLGMLCAGMLVLLPPPGRSLNRAISLAAALTLLTITGLLLHTEYRTREHLPKAAIQQKITAWLADHGEQDALLVVPYWDIEWLCRTGHPIMADYQSAHRITYIPALAPSAKKIHHEIYGVWIDQPDSGLLDDWETRSLETWQALGKEYDFRYVVSPVEIPLPLIDIFAAGQHCFYRIPPANLQEPL